MSETKVASILRLTVAEEKDEILCFVLIESL